LIFDQDSCYYCDLLKQDTLSDLEVQEILNNDYIVADVDINREASLAAEYQVFGTPTMVFLECDANQIYSIEGYVPADEFLDDLKGI
jgi:thiol:disulfide interchange protein DsbD